MQSKTLFFNPTVFQSNIKRYLAFPILYTLILFFAAPFLLIKETLSTDQILTRQAYMMFLEPTNTTYPVAGYMICIVLAVFFFLYHPRSANMFHAYPLSRRCLFLTNIASIVAMSVMPILIDALAATGMAYFLRAVSFHTIKSLVWSVWYWATLTIGYTFVFLGIAVFTAMVSGQLLTNAVFYAIFHFLFIGMEIVIRFLVSTISFGMANIGISPTVTNFLCPILYLGNLPKRYYPATAESAFGNTPGSTLLVLGIYVLCGIGFLMVSYVLYLRKRTESAGEFITIPILKPIFAIGASFFISVTLSVMLVYSVMEYWSVQPVWIYALTVLSCLLLGAVVYFVCLMLIQKTRHVFGRKDLCRFAVYAAASTVALMAIITDAFGMEQRLPDTDDVVAAEICGREYLTLTQPEEIAQLLDAHREILSHKSDFLPSHFNYQAGYVLHFRYLTKEGSVIKRSYRLCDLADGSKTYQEVYRKLMDYLNQPDLTKRAIFSDQYAQARAEELFAPEFYKYNDEDATKQMKTYDAADAAKVYEAFLRDVDEGFYPYLPAESDYRRTVTLFMTLRLPKAGCSPYELFDCLQSEISAQPDSINSYPPSETISVTFYADESCVNTLAALKEIGALVE